MQPHISDGTLQQAAPTPVADRRGGENRWSANLIVTRYVVVLNLGPAYRAELINESNDGIAVQVRALDPSAAIGREIDVIYRGKRHGAEIRHITEIEHGFLVGLQWKSRFVQ